MNLILLLVIVTIGIVIFVIMVSVLAWFGYCNSFYPPDNSTGEM